MGVLKGIDASRYQGEPDWDKVAGEFRFAILKAIQGTSYYFGPAVSGRDQP
jgi:GH25 family lysozyme M1 (1,4-beta-N-acetylmuramidase)